MEFTNVSFSIDLDNGNSGLVDDPGTAVANILRKIANEIDGEITSDDLEQSATIFDINGNTVGSWYMTCEGEEIETCDECGKDLEDDTSAPYCVDCADDIYGEPEDEPVDEQMASDDRLANSHGPHNS